MNRNTVWMYWHSGEETAPELVKACIQSWRERNQSWHVNVLSDRSLHEHVQMHDVKECNPDISLQAFSDALRWRLLKKYGGTWADATLFCRAGIETWITLKDNCPIYFIKSRNEHYYFSWFIRAEARSEIVRAMNVEIDRQLIEFGGFREYMSIRAAWRLFRFIEANAGFWNSRLWGGNLMLRELRVFPYYWVMYAMGRVLRSDKAAADEYNRIPDSICDSPHLIQRLFERRPFPNKQQLQLMLKNTPPVLKLTLKRHQELWENLGLLEVLNGGSSSQSPLFTDLH